MDRYEITIGHTLNGGQEIYQVWNASGVLVYVAATLSEAQEWLDHQENKDVKDS